MNTHLVMALGFDLQTIPHQIISGVRWYQVSELVNILGLSNTTNSASRKVPQSHKRRIYTETIERNGRRYAVRPLFVTETGMWMIIMLGRKDSLQAIRSRIAQDILPRIRTLD